MSSSESDSGPDSSYSASEASESLPSTSEGRGRGRPRKRRFQETPRSSHAHVKHVKSGYSDKYCKLFNETLSEIVSPETTRLSLARSQIGVNIWSSEEKDLFFSSLARRGKHDLRRIATEIGSKSESEISVFIEKLQHAANEEQIWELAPKKLFRSYEIDAAFEISEECCASLDVAAKSLSGLQYREEERTEIKRYGDFALLTPKIAKWVDGRLQAGEPGEEEVSRTLPPARLLNLKMFLSLSKRLFMNSSITENNWRSYAERPRSPLLMYTAFQDFHNLTTSLTKRLIQSSLFFAMSRLRALDASGQYSPKRRVRRGDVLTALDVLGIDRNSKQMWVRTARKCNWRVYDKVRYRKISGKRYSYDKVEEILSSKYTRPCGGSVSSLRSTTDLSEMRQSDISESSSTDDMSKSDSPAFPSGIDNDSSGQSSHIHNNDASASTQVPLEESEGPEDPQDSYTSVLDHRASQAEERRLWSLLNKSPPPIIHLKSIPLPKTPGSERKHPDDLIDWSTSFDYVQEWERYEQPVPASRFMENRKGRWRVGEVDGLTTSDTGFEDLERDVDIARKGEAGGETESDGGASVEPSSE